MKALSSIAPKGTQQLQGRLVFHTLGDQFHPQAVAELDYGRDNGPFGAPIYHCTFCRLQFRDFHGLEPNGKAKAQAQA